jgi:multidrug resistance efflux pump
MSENADLHDPSNEKAKAPRDPVRRWTIIVAAALLFLLALQIASDRTAPVSSIGTVEGLVLPISPRVSGELLRVAVGDDEIVDAGAVLFEIDPTPFRLAVEAAEADLAQVGQSIGASTADVAAAQARVAEAQAVLTNSRAQAERTLELVARGVTPAAQGDEAIAEVAAGEATVAAAEADLRSAEEALGPAGVDNPQLRAAQAALETAQFDLSQTQVVAPTRGRVTNFSLGPGETANAGQPVLTMIDLQGAWMVAYFRENQLGNMQVGDTAEVVLDVLPGQVWPASLVSFSGGIMTVNQAGRHAAAAAVAGRAAAVRRPAAVRSAGPAAAQRTAGLAGDGDGLHRRGRLAPAVLEAPDPRPGAVLLCPLIRATRSRCCGWRWSRRWSTGRRCGWARRCPSSRRCSLPPWR